MQPTLEGFEDFDDYERRKERARESQAKQSQSGRDIGPLPKVPPKGLAIKERCEYDLRTFLEFFLKPVFKLAWSPDHLEAIKTLEDVFLKGGQFAYAMPRGNGKTSLSIGATLWAMVYGHRRFIVPICATGPKAEQYLESIKTIIETNSRLAKVFPEVCYPIQRLDGINNRVAGQILNGERTRIKWTGKRLILPTVAGSAASGVIVHAAGLLGSVRGLSQASPEAEGEEESDDWWQDTGDLDAALEPEIGEDGGMIRPDAGILDDPQTDDSAKVPAQTQKRLNVIDKAVLNLAGPNKKIAIVCPCTVILPNDLADQLLDREQNPEWRGRRTKLLTEMPNEAAMKLWGQYKEIRAESLRVHEDIRDATEFYKSNHAAMSAGAVVAWPERFEEAHHDALQYAMDKWAKSESAFYAEYQNDPRPDEQAGVETLNPKLLLARCDGSERGAVPDWADRITGYIDIQQDVLFYAIVAWGDDLRGHVIDYGAWPEQQREYYNLREISPTLQQATGHPTIVGAIDSGLGELAETLFASRWVNEAGEAMRLEWLGVDANWAVTTQVVYAASKRYQRLHPCHGRGIGAASLPMSEWKKKPGEKRGHFWRQGFVDGYKVFTIDNNSWKTLVCKRLQGDPAGGITWFGSKPHRHQMWCEHLAAEFGVRTVGRGRTVDEWKNRPGRDNHWWDCLVGAAVGASVQGASMPGQARRTGRKRKSLKDLLGGPSV